jgi:hypothetical protein
MAALQILAPDSRHSVLSPLVEAENACCVVIFRTESLAVQMSLTAIPTL